jgi:hypothetical protein
MHRILPYLHAQARRELQAKRGVDWLASFYRWGSTRVGWVAEFKEIIAKFYMTKAKTEF